MDLKVPKESGRFGGNPLLPLAPLGRNFVCKIKIADLGDKPPLLYGKYLESSIWNVKASLKGYYETLKRNNFYHVQVEQCENIDSYEN